MARRREPESADRGADWDQMDVLDEKDGVTQSGRGFQLWGDDVVGPPGRSGEGTVGTAERHARILEGQRRQKASQEDETREA